MTTSAILGVAIGVIFVFMLFSLFLSASLEAISAVLKLRGRALRVAIARLIDDPQEPVGRGGFGLIDNALDLWHSHSGGPVAVQQAASGPLIADAVDAESPELHEAPDADGDHQPPQPLGFFDVFCHPLVAGASGSSKPSYVPAANFSSAVLHALLREDPDASIDALTRRVAKLPEGSVRTALESALLDARGDWDALRAGIDRWYANAMDRLSGEYKRFSQLITFLLGLALAACFNIDTIALARQLYADPVMREQLADQAAHYVQAPPPAASGAASDPDVAYKEAIDHWVQARDLLTRTVPGANAAAQLPTLKDIGSNGIGWLVTALAGMLGAPFWFDLLQKLTNLRGTGPKPEPAPEPT